MRRLFLGLFSILTLIFASSTPASAVNTNDFYFTDYTADYYLSKTEEGAGFMQIIENLTAVFPTSNQNHGIDRCIPRKYNGTSILVNPNFTVFRNLKEEPFTTRVDGKFLCLRIGDANQYVHGTQGYTIIYNVENVILEPNNSTYQELYWDANGTGWSQKFQSVTANLHISEDLDSARKSQSDSDISCYVGKYGTSDTAATSRCKFSSEPDTESGFSTVITFTADSLKAGETLTFVIEFMPKTFSIKEPDPDYTVYIIIGGVVLICSVIIIYWSVASRKIKDKRNLARNTSVPVQYIPPKGLTVAEAGTVWLKSEKALQVATLMQLAVTHKVELEKGEKKRFGGYDWKIHIKNANHLSEEQEIVLKILNGGHTFHTGDTIKVQRHSSDSSLISLGRSFSKEITKSLRRKHLFEPENTKSSAMGVITGLAFVTIIFIIFPAFIYPIIKNNSSDSTVMTIFVFGFISFIFLVVALGVISSRIKGYKERTVSGIETSLYMDGLKEYMQLAEADRIKFLQSVEGVDTSHNGIAKLYEKLLPYAVVFGIEDSWMEELNKYYEMEDVDASRWIATGAILSASDFHSFTSYTSSSIYSSTASSDSGGSSGGGGGGFSGGGGGGGGGGGW